MQKLLIIEDNINQSNQNTSGFLTDKSHQKELLKKIMVLEGILYLVQTGKSKKAKVKRKNLDNTSILAIFAGLFIYANLY